MLEEEFIRTYKNGTNKELVESIDSILWIINDNIEDMLENNSELLAIAEEELKDNTEGESKKRVSLCKELLAISKDLENRVSKMLEESEQLSIILKLYEAKDREIDFYWYIVENSLEGEITIPGIEN